jgi:cytochrome P450
VLLLEKKTSARNPSRSSGGVKFPFRAMTTSALLRQENLLELWMLLASLFAVLAGWYARSRQNTKAFLAKSNIPFIERSAEGNAFPWLGHVPTFLRWRPWDVLEAWHNRHGPIIAYTLFGNTMYSIASPSLLRQTLQSKIANVKKDVANVMKPFLSILGTGIVTSEDAAWMKQRLKMSHPLRKDVLEIIPRQTVAAVQRLCRSMDAQQAAGEAVALGSSLRHLTLQVISGSFLSLTAEESDSTFARMYLPIVEEANVRVWHPYRAYLIFLPSFWSYQLNVRRLNLYVSRLIRLRWLQRRVEQQNTGSKRSSRPLDMLDRVLQAYEKEYPEAKSMSSKAVRQVRDEMKTFMLAGHETSAAMMTWALYELLQNHEVCERVRAEGQSIFGPNTDVGTMQSIPENLSALIWSEASLKEALRKYSVVPMVARRIVRDMYVQDQGTDYFLPAGNPVLVHLQAIHRNPALWPDPLRFDPTRFLQKNPPAPFTFVPFIAGPRNCLGQHLALLESKMVLSMLLQRYDLEVVGDSPTGPDPRHRFMVPVIPEKEVWVRVRARLDVTK